MPREISFRIWSSAKSFFFRLRIRFSATSKNVWASAKVDRAGFEPAASALRTRRSYQTDLPARFCKKTVLYTFRAFGQSKLSSVRRTTENNTVLLREKQPNSMHKSSLLYIGGGEEQQQEFFELLF